MEHDARDVSDTHVHFALLCAHKDVEDSHYDRHCHGNYSGHTDGDTLHDDAKSLQALAVALMEAAEVAYRHKNGIDVRNGWASVVEEMAWEVEYLHDIHRRERVDNTRTSDLHMDCRVG